MRRRTLSFVALAAVLTVVGAACNRGGAGPGPEEPGATTFQRGGTLHIGQLADVEAAMDPAREYYSVAWSYLRDMHRTLLQYPAAPAPQGNTLSPDLATALPEASPDGLTWTYKLKPNVEFGPPISRAIVCADVKAGFERMFTPAGEGGYNFYYTVIEGASDFQGGKADEISGIQCPDDQTITFTLTEPTGDFNFRTAMPATAPIPAAEDITKGHDQDYGRLQVSSGCYQLEGVDKVNFDAAKPDYPPGYQPNRSMTLVRNENWDETTDDLRNCYVDRIELTIGGEESDLFNKVQQNTLDWIEDAASNAESLQAFRADPNLQDQISPLYYTDSTYYIWLNVTTPPFDDVHVRKAVNWIINKDALLRIRGGPDFGQVATHIVPPSMAGALPASYDPYATPGHRGDLAKAQAEMKQATNYDTDGDGVCDASACQDVFHVTDSADPYPDLTSAIEEDLQKIGITLNNKFLDRPTMYNFYSTPAKDVAFGTGAGWGKDYADQLTFIDPLFNGANIQPSGNVNYSELNDPQVNQQIENCKGQTGNQRLTCWANIDKYLMENVANWIPWRWGAHRIVYSDRIANYTITQFSGDSAWSEVALTQAAIQQG